MSDSIEREIERLPLALKPADVARVTRQGINQTRAALASGRIPAVRCGRSWRISRDALLEWLRGEQANAR
jgi:excisionase family DNA binding protein